MDHSSSSAYVDSGGATVQKFTLVSSLLLDDIITNSLQCPPGSRQKNLFLHANVAEQSGPKLIIQSLIDRAGLRHSRLQ